MLTVWIPVCVHVCGMYQWYPFLGSGYFTCVLVLAPWLHLTPVCPGKDNYSYLGNTARYEQHSCVFSGGHSTDKHSSGLLEANGMKTTLQQTWLDISTHCLFPVWMMSVTVSQQNYVKNMHFWKYQECLKSPFTQTTKSPLGTQLWVTLRPMHVLFFGVQFQRKRVPYSEVLLY